MVTSLFVAGVLFTGIGNTLFITGFYRYLADHLLWTALLLLKCALVVLYVAIALTHRYVSYHGATENSGLTYGLP